MKKLLLISTILIYTSSLFAQEVKCPFDELGCKGKCGLFCDTNTDTYCDHTILYNDNEIISEDNSKINNDNSIKTKSESTNSDTNVVSVEKAEMLSSANNESEKTQNEVSVKKKPYHILPILITLLGLFVLTLILVKMGIISQSLYRKIWNIALTISFLVSGLLGILIAFFINYSYVPDYYLTIMMLHVDVGIAMVVIAIFHALWHVSYYKNILKISKSKQLK